MAVNLPQGFVLDEQPQGLPEGFVLDSSAPTQPEPEPDTFASRLQKDFDRRIAAINRAETRMKLWQPYTQPAKPGEYRGQGLNPISGTLQQAGQYVGGGFDILGEGATSLYNAIPESVKDTVVGRAVGQTATTNLVPGLEAVTGIKTSPAAIASTVGSGVEAAREYAPDAVANIEAAANIIPVAQASGAVMRGAGKAAVRGVENLATPARVMPNSEQLAGMAVKGYEAARASGEVFDAPSVTNKFIAAIDSAKPKMIAGAVETDLSRSLESNLGEYRKLLDKPLSIDEVDIIDKDLSNLKDQAYKSGKNQLASELSNIQNTLRGSVADSPSGETLAQARDLYRRKYQMEDVERIFRNAEGRPNPTTIIQTGYRNLANQARKKGSGYTKEQVALMDKAAKGGFSIDALKLLSSKLIPIVAGASGNVVGAGAAYMGNLAAGAGAKTLQTAKANKLAQSITKGITVESEPTLINRLAQRLTKADLQAAFEARKAESNTVRENLYRGTRNENQINPNGAIYLTPQKEYAEKYGNVKNYNLNKGESIDLTQFGQTSRIDDIYNYLKNKFGNDTAEKLLNSNSIIANDTDIDVYSIFKSPENVKILKDNGIDVVRFAQESDGNVFETVAVLNPSKLKKGKK